MKKRISRPSDYTVIKEMKKVLVTVPSHGTDIHFKLIPEHVIKVNGDNVVIKKYYRRGNIFRGSFVTSNYYVPYEMTGRKILASVRVLSKINYFKGEVSLVLDIYPELEEGVPEYILKVGTPNSGPEAVAIPSDPSKYINFKSFR